MKLEWSALHCFSLVQWSWLVRLQVDALLLQCNWVHYCKSHHNRTIISYPIYYLLARKPGNIDETTRCSDDVAVLPLLLVYRKSWTSKLIVMRQQQCAWTLSLPIKHTKLKLYLILCLIIHIFETYHVFSVYSYTYFRCLQYSSFSLNCCISNYRLVNRVRQISYTIILVEHQTFKKTTKSNVNGSF